jgi:hypothetical protein
MTNSGIIEGIQHLCGVSACAKMSDLSLAISSCQSVPNPPMNVGNWATIGRAANLPNGSMRVFHGAGTTDEENNAGRYSKLMSGLDWEFSVAATSWSGDSMAYGSCQPLEMTPHCYRNHRNPYIGEGMHTRPQPFTFGSGENCTKKQKNPVAWGLSGFTPPRS